MTAIPTGISEAHEVTVRAWSCEATTVVAGEQVIEAIDTLLGGAALTGDCELAVRLSREAIDRLADADTGVCSFRGDVEGIYLDGETAEVVCPKCGTVAEVAL